MHSFGLLLMGLPGLFSLVFGFIWGMHSSSTVHFFCKTSRVNYCIKVELCKKIISMYIFFLFCHHLTINAYSLQVTETLKEWWCVLHFNSIRNSDSLLHELCFRNTCLIFYFPVIQTFISVSSNTYCYSFQHGSKLKTDFESWSGQFPKNKLSSQSFHSWISRCYRSYFTPSASMLSLSAISKNCKSWYFFHISVHSVS